MKAIHIAFIVIVAFASNAYGQQKVAALIEKVAKNCMKKTGVNRDQIIECTMTPTDEWDSNPDCTPAAQCFFGCPFSMLLDSKKCFDCDKGIKMIQTFMKGPDLEEMGACLTKGMKQCCPGLQKVDCCKNHYDLIACMYPICGEIIAKHLTGVAK
uniref:Odorant binding protein 4 n=1 Tax=Trissolcus japonicus TaxID=1388796 RepID=A0A8K1NE89_9HYME|nr:odorant binding protein 4 [Trissolcus japonicus]